MNVLNEIKTLLGMEVKLAQMKLENGTVLEAEVFETGQPIFIVNEDERIALPIGEYIMEDKMVLVVAEEGIIAEVKEAVAEEEAPEVEEEVEAQVETPSAAPSTPKRIVESVSKEMFFAEIEKLRTEIAELKLAKEVKAELSADVVVEPLTHSPETKQEVKLNLYSPKRQMSTKDVVMSKLFN